MFTQQAVLLHDGIEGSSPVLVWFLHHDVDEGGHEKAQYRGSIAHLIPIHGAVPGRAAMYELVAQDVEPVEDEAQGAGGILRGEGPGEGDAGRRRCDAESCLSMKLLPVLVSLDPVVLCCHEGTRIGERTFMDKQEKD